ncbi:MAG: RNA polymerase factor sigma-54 [Pseudoflavonifractor sp.]|nr:RNA polymerase factor sigma-54 [Alloprevotella sp.]MCM1117485.1 RNA polymerase factor sigma-54 [Pseudoflavonifractor sp.]
MPSSSHSPRHSLSQVQSLKQQQSLSPQQVLYVRLLELNALEMEEEVSRTLDENPALEAVSDPMAEAADVSNATDEEGRPFEESAESLQLGDFSDAEDVPFVVGDISDSFANFLSESGRADPSVRARETADAGAMSTVMDHLAAQLAELPLSPRQRLIATHIIGNIDDNGYLTVSLPQIADDLAIQDGIEVSPDEVKIVFNAIRQLDPPGICALDLRDCLLLQLRRLGRSDKSPDLAVATEMIADFFDFFSKRHFDRLTSALSVDRDRLKRAIDIVRSLNPKPGAMISGSHADNLSASITPDFIVDSDGQNIDLEMTNTIPELRVESSFDIDDAALGIQKGQKSSRAASAASFIRSRRDEATTYINAIRQRRDTLYRVMRAIISLQRDFFTGDGDPTLLHPMILKDVAAITGDDISVISRAATGKYVATRYGTYPLRFFFSEAPTSDIADSPIKILETLRAIIRDEDPANPLGDEALADILAKKGYSLARRTVAKYREKAGIPIARLRKHL